MSESKPSQRFHSLKPEQVEVLHQVLSDVVPIHGRGNFPTLELRPRDIIIAVRARLQRQGITVRDVRLNGSTASHVLVRDNGTSYKDLDIIFGVELPSQEEFQVIKESVMGCLLDCLPTGVNRERISSATMKEAYVQKMVKVFNEHDRWSLISLSNNSGKNLELKFVSSLRRQFEFSVDSFQIILDRLLESYMHQESQRKNNPVDLKEQPAERQRKDSPAPLKQASETQRSICGDPAGPEKRAQTSQPEQKQEVPAKESQAELSDQSKMSTLDEENKENTPNELEEHGESSSEGGLSQQTPPNTPDNKPTAETQTQIEREPEPSDVTECSAEVEQSERTGPCEGQEPAHSNRTEPFTEQQELAEQAEPNESPKTLNADQAELPHLSDKSHNKELSDKTDFCERGSQDQRHNEGEKNASARDTGASSRAETETVLTDERKHETEEQIQAESGEATEISQTTDEGSAPEAKQIDDTQGIDCFCSTFLPSVSPHNTQPDGTQDTHSTLPIDKPDKPVNTMDAVHQPDTQDTLPAPPSLVSDKKSSSPASSKASERLSHMVVLKHSSPKPPRRMCRKVAPSPYPGPVESDPVTVSCLDPTPCPSPDPDTAFDAKPNADKPSASASPDSTPPVTVTSAKTNPEPEPDPSSHLASNPDFTSAPDTAPDVIPTSAADPVSALPQQTSSSPLLMEGLFEIQSQEETPLPAPTRVALDEQSQPSPGETASPPKHPDSLDTLVSHTDGSSSDTHEPAHTSDVGPGGDRDEDRELQGEKAGSDLPDVSSQETTPSSPSPEGVTLHVSCVTPPMVSLSPPCFTSSPPSPSPPPCLTPPSHCLPSPILSTISSAASFSSPPLSFSPTSSCLSSPPYLTPPMLSLNPTPLCLTPPSPCLSPPLLCLTPPVESEELIPQVSSEMEPLILNTDSEEQIKEPSTQQGVPVLQLEDEKEQEYISLLPQVAEPVSFPITIPKSTSHSLPHSPPGDPGESAPSNSTEASSSVPENKEAHKVISDMPEQTNPPPATCSVPAVEVLAESMYGDFEAAMDHLRYRLIATRNPEEIRGGGLLKYSNLLVRDYRPASETQIKTLERYMCSRFFIDFPDVQEQQRKILSYLKNHFIGEERSKYQYLMTLRRVVDDSTVCLMGHERRQTLNMITVLALKVLGEQNIIPNTDHVTCFYQPAPYLADHSTPYITEPSYCSYYIPQGGSTLLYQPYPLHLHSQTGLV